MRTKERSEFGARLYEARKRANLSQKDLAEQVGMAQSAIAEAERHAQGSSKTAQLARALGVRAEWLADGTGPMTQPQEEPSTAARQVASEQVAHYLVGTPASSDYRTIALALADALEESGNDVTVRQFIRLLEATYSKLHP